MTTSTLYFLLVPDAGAARGVRRLIAERCTCSGVVVGTWPELIEWARQAYLLPEAADEWEPFFAEALGSIKDAFWSESYPIAPAETAAAVRLALEAVLSATEPGSDSSAFKLDGLAERPRRHLVDLRRLAGALAGRLPPELATIRELLAADRSDALRMLKVTFVEGVPTLTRWQRALIGKLNRDSGDVSSDEVLGAVLKRVLVKAGHSAPGALGALQSRLFRPGEIKVPLDESAQWLGVRDFLQEAEVAAGMAQRLLAEDVTLAPAQIGLLLPDDFEYAIAVEDAFKLAGLALSGLPAERWRRDLGREAVFHFLYCRQTPAPAMALAVVLSSPLMPWSREQGAQLAQAVMEGDYALKAPKGAGVEARAMLALLRNGDYGVATLSAALEEFCRLIDGNEEFAAHVAQARDAVADLLSLLATSRRLEWPALRRAVTPRLLTRGEAADFNHEGVTVWRASQEPWRSVRRLIVLGFAQGHYPAASARNAVFSADDLAQVRTHAGLSIETPAEALTRRRAQFRRQLGSVTETVSFLVPRRDPSGTAQAASESLVFMHRLFEGPDTADELIVELDAAEDRSRARGVAFAAPVAPQPPRALQFEDLQFQRDLVALRVDEQGQPKPESPSSLETLMVSRLAWLLRRLDAEPLQWAPEGVNPALLGTVAHDVFEQLFAPGVPLPSSEELPTRVATALDDVLTRIAPFLRAAQWSVERRHLTAQTITAARAWRDTLEQLGAEVVAAEEWLAGRWGDIAVHGQTDLILALPGDRLLVVDYKRSSSRKRLTQMQKGFDSQASLYRAMLASGGPKDLDKQALAVRLRKAADTGVVYYLMNDQVALSDSKLALAGHIPTWRAVEGDIAGQALGLIEQRLREARAGTLKLNRVRDREFFEKEAGITPYALDASPLIAACTLPDEEGEP